jgi:Zn-dependent peptidase ImmA (M78 family)|tara:strand:- start:270 stop:1454 length:1185 start_codon:yes stop_codon:yes gene_type:complete
MANINSAMLEWAREQAGLSVDDAVRLLDIKSTKTATAEEKLIAYEHGKAPSRSMLARMSKAYRRPLLTFYLNEPPKKTDRGEDFRTLPENLDPQQNFHVDVLIRDIKARQSIIRETLIDEDEAEALPFVGQFSSEQGIDEISRKITELFDIDLDTYRSKRNYADAFKYLRQKVEAKGVFVLLKGNLGSYHTDIDLKVFRGFALCDDVAPFIVINHQEAKSARAFTLLHELTHLLLGQTGISSSIVERKIEKFCDRVASEVLLPEQEFSEFDPENLEFEDLKEAISFYAQDRRISSAQVAYRCLQDGLINKGLWSKLRDYYYEQWVEGRRLEKERGRNNEGGVNQNIVRRSYLGELVNFVQRMNFSGALSTTKAGVVLGVKPLKVQNLFDNAQVV